MTREEFIAAHPIAEALSRAGVHLVPASNKDKDQKAAKCPFHEDGKASLSVNVGTGLWHCHAGCGGGSVIDLLAKMNAKSASQVLWDAGVRKSDADETKPKPSGNGTLGSLIRTYEYRNIWGTPIYRVLRYDPKNFRQQRWADDGWVWGMEGVERVLYRLPEVAEAKSVWLVEGEKDAENLSGLGFIATTNVGGGGKWLDSYSEMLAGKDVCICGDNDQTGRDHVEKVFASLAGKAHTVRLIGLPGQVKDVSDFIDTFPAADAARTALLKLAEDAVPFTKGVRMPLYSMPELEVKYRAHLAAATTDSLDLGAWLPSLGCSVRKLVPGELAVLLADTGTGKTAMLQSIAIAASPLPTVFFELELPPELMYERLVAMKHGIPCEDVERAYRDNVPITGASEFPNLYICTEAGLSVDSIEEMINHSELRIGSRPKLVLVDYIGLVGARGASRYDRISNIAERLKTIAKLTRTIIVCASQVHRPEDSEPEVGLHDAKDSGSIENSSGFVLGGWRDPSYKATMWLKILKNTKGSSGKLIECNFDGPTLRITEKAKITEADIPSI